MGDIILSKEELSILIVNLTNLIHNAYGLWMDLSGALWVFGFALFAWQYAPILLYPRVDGRPG